MFSLPYMRILVPVFVGFAILALGAYIHLTLKEARYTMMGPTTITVVGEGESIAVPDIATFSFTVLGEGADAQTAQTKSADSVNAILAYLKEQGVEDKDIRTEYYNLYPEYEYLGSVCDMRGYCPPGEQVLKGYAVSQSVQVKVRATDKAGELISGVGERGATNVSSLQFTMDDSEVQKSEARELAIADARRKAEELAENLDVRLVRMTGFWEEQPYYPYDGYGMGGMDMAKEQAASSVPGLPTGENTTTVKVNITYEIR